ncbi:MAG: response regulator [Cyclobacteriaceae bacterium]|nr:response regulator [Cyclobacteriaceae bacterium]
MKYNILYVEDDEVLIYLFKRSFKAYFNILTAVSAEEALNVLENEEIHLLITDQYLPGFTGTELLKEIKGKYFPMSKVMITGSDETDVLREAFENGEICNYVQKPWNDDIFLFTMNKALETYQLKKDLAEAQKSLELKN